MRRGRGRVRRRRRDDLREPAAVRGRARTSPPTPATSTGDLAPGRGGRRRPRASRPSVEEMYPRAGAHDGRRSPTSPRRFEGAARPDPLRRRRHRGGQAVRHRRAVPGLLRREGLPAARRRPAHGRRPVVPGRGGRLPDRARGRRPGPVEPQRLPHARGAGRRAGAAPGAAGRRRRGRGRRARPGARSRRSWPTIVAAEPLAELDYAEVVDAAHPRSRSTRWPASCGCWSPPASAGPPPRQPRRAVADRTDRRGQRTGATGDQRGVHHQGAARCADA